MVFVGPGAGLITDFGLVWAALEFHTASELRVSSLALVGSLVWSFEALSAPCQWHHGSVLLI